MIIQSSDCRRIIAVRMNPDDDVLLTLRAAVRDAGIHQGVILNGIGSLRRYHVHVVGLAELPTKDIFFEEAGPYDILAVSGLILEGRVHAHITFSNTEKAMGGHMEEGCHVLTFAMVMIAETPELDMAGWDRVGSL